MDRGVISSALLLTVIVTFTAAVPTTSAHCGNGCHCYHLPEGGKAANCSSFDIKLENRLPSDLRTLRVLPGTPGLTSFLSKGLKHSFPHLKELYLSNNEIGSIHLISLCKLKRLRVLDLSFCGISDPAEVANLVRQCTHLEKLKLTGNSLPTIQSLESSSLLDLDLSYCRISTVDFDAFKGLVELRHLIISGNRLSNFAAVELPKTLRFLDLSDNAVVQLSPERLTMLRHLNIERNPIHCTCSLVGLRNRHSGEYVAVRWSGECVSADQPQGQKWSEFQRICEWKILQRNENAASRMKRQADDLGEGMEGSGDGFDYDDDDDDDDYDNYDDAVPSEGNEEKETPVSNLGEHVNVDAEPKAETTRSLEDDIYTPSVAPPIPASVDSADRNQDSNVETPPEVGPSEKTPTSGETLSAVTPKSVEAGSVTPENNNDVDDYDDEYDEALDADEDDETNEDVPAAVTETDGSKHAGVEDSILVDSSSTAPDASIAAENENIGAGVVENVNKIFDEQEGKGETTQDENLTFDEENEITVPEEFARNDNVAGAVVSEEENKKSNETTDAVLPVLEPNLTKSSSEVSEAEPEGSGESDDEDSTFAAIVPGFMDSEDKQIGSTTARVPKEDEPLLIDEDGDDDNQNSPLAVPESDASTESVITDKPKMEENEAKEVPVIVDGLLHTENSTTQSPDFGDEEDDEQEGSGFVAFGLAGGLEDAEENGNETGRSIETSSDKPVSGIEEDMIKTDEVFIVGSGRDLGTSEAPITTTEKVVQKSRGGLHSLVIGGEAKDDDGGLTTKLPDAGEETSPRPSGTEAVPPVVEVAAAGTTTRSTPSPTASIAESSPHYDTGFPKVAFEGEVGGVSTSESPLLAPNLDENIVEGDLTDVESVDPTGDSPLNDTARVIAAGGATEDTEETPLNSAGSYVVLGIIMALVVFLLGYAVMRSRRSRRRRAKPANEKDPEAGGQEGRELKEISKPLLAQPNQPAANGKGEHLQPLVTKPAGNPDLKDDDADDKPVLEVTPRIHIYESLNGGDKEHVPVVPPSVKTKPSPDGRAISRLPDATDAEKPSMYAAAEIFPQEAVVVPEGQHNGDAQPAANGLSTFGSGPSPVSPRSGRVKVVAREDPDSVPKKPVFVVNHGPNAPTEHV